MALPDFNLRQLLEAGVHFGHQTHRWNPKMGRYIYGERNGIHIVDLTQTVPLLDAALQAMRETVSKGGRILFVGTKRQAQRPIADAAERCAQYFMNHRWLGGTLTNWKTVSHSINRLKALDERLEAGATGLTKKERLHLERERHKLQMGLGGIREMGGLPDMLFVIDTNKEALAVAEAKKLNIPVVAILDTNSDPDGIQFPIPGNDDAGRAIGLYCDLTARAVIDGMAGQLEAAGFDLGELEEAPVEEAAAKPEEPAGAGESGEAAAEETAAAEPAAAPSEEPAAVSSEEASEKPSAEAAEKPSEETAEKPSGKAAKKSSGKAAEKSSEETEEKSSGKAAEKASEETEKSSEETAEEPSEEAAEKARTG